MSDNKSLAHTKWNCKYHIVFAPKYRRQVFLRREEKNCRGCSAKALRMERREDY